MIRIRIGSNVNSLHQRLQMVAPETPVLIPAALLGTFGKLCNSLWHYVDRLILSGLRAFGIGFGGIPNLVNSVLKGQISQLGQTVFARFVQSC
ncbi:hypothetical protein MPLSOD_80221 [Mesorhizobium sp. SOD10]|nr:hypothetical protein MPLSOD_80221 [Mesorhizobium sp. SOD10]